MITLALTSIVSPSEVKAEDPYMWDAGAVLGMSGYLGDAGGSNPFRRPGVMFGGLARYNFNERWAMRGQMSVSTLSGNTADFDNVYPDNAEYSFRSTVGEFSVRGECNFLPYGMGEAYKSLSRWSPFVSVGVGVSMINCDGASSFSPVIPLSAGVKYKMTRRLNLSVEFSMTKTFSDKIDGESLDDPYGIKSSFIKNTDWYSALSVSLTYEFGQRCSVCNRIN